MVLIFCRSSRLKERIWMGEMLYVMNRMKDIENQLTFLAWFDNFNLHCNFQKFFSVKKKPSIKTLINKSHLKKYIKQQKSVKIRTFLKYDVKYKILK